MIRVLSPKNLSARYQVTIPSSLERRHSSQISRWTVLRCYLAWADCYFGNPSATRTATWSFPSYSSQSRSFFVHCRNWKRENITYCSELYCSTTHLSIVISPLKQLQISRVTILLLRFITNCLRSIGRQQVWCIDTIEILLDICDRWLITHHIYRRLSTTRRD